MPLSEGDQGYSVAENKVRSHPSYRPTDSGNAPGQKKPGTAGGIGVDPQFSNYSDISAIHGNKGGAPAQPSTGYHRAD